MEIKKKVLLVGPDFFHYMKSIEVELNEKDYCVTSCLFEESAQFQSLWMRIIVFLFGPLFLSARVKKFNKEVLEISESLKPDIIFVIKGNFLYKKTFQQWSKYTKILWMMDSIFSYRKSLDTVNFYDHIFCFEKMDVTGLKDMGINSTFLPLAVDENLFHPIYNVKKDIDLLFVGTLYRERFLFFKSLLQKEQKLNIWVVGPIADRYIRLKIMLGFLRLDPRFRIKAVNTSELINLYGRSKIVLNIHHPQSIYGVNPRFFEIIATNSFQIVDKKPFVADYFNQFEIVQYSSFDELFDLIHEYLVVGKDLKISEQLRSFVLKHHSFKARISEVLSVLNLDGEVSKH